MVQTCQNGNNIYKIKGLDSRRTPICGVDGPVECVSWCFASDWTAVNNADTGSAVLVPAPYTQRDSGRSKPPTWENNLDIWGTWKLWSIRCSEPAFVYYGGFGTSLLQTRVWHKLTNNLRIICNLLGGNYS